MRLSYRKLATHLHKPLINVKDYKEETVFWFNNVLDITVSCNLRQKVI